MSAFALSAANVRSMWRRFVGLTALIAIAVALCTTAFAISGNAERAAHDRVQEGAANRSITVDRLAERPGAKPLRDAALGELAALPHVISVQPRAQVSFGYKDAQVPGVLLYATTVRPAQPPPVTRSARDKLFPLQDGEIIVPATAQDTSLAPLLGRTITVQTTRAVANGQGTGAEARVRVVGLFDPGWQLDGPDAAYADDATVIRWAAAKAGVTPEQFTNSIGYDRISVVVDSAGNVPDVLARIQAAGYAGSTLQQELNELPGVLALIRTTGKVLLVVLGVIALVGALVVTGALARQRVREIGILKAVGFRSRTILTMLITEMAMVGAAGAVAGGILGAVGAAAAAAAFRSRTELAPYLPSRLPLPAADVLGALLLITLAVTVLGAWLPAHRAARLAPSDAIKEW
ncbi:MAG: transporter permease [Dactylosporangium sp.]|jgi:putative ABC transport system permease protein|nr:transporter permease [Dactylosporangium sp.]